MIVLGSAFPAVNALRVFVQDRQISRKYCVRHGPVSAHSIRLTGSIPAAVLTLGSGETPSANSGLYMSPRAGVSAAMFTGCHAASPSRQMSGRSSCAVTFPPEIRTICGTLAGGMPLSSHWLIAPWVTGLPPSAVMISARRA